MDPGFSRNKICRDRSFGGYSERSFGEFTSPEPLGLCSQLIEVVDFLRNPNVSRFLLTPRSSSVRSDYSFITFCPRIFNSG